MKPKTMKPKDSFIHHFRHQLPATLLLLALGASSALAQTDGTWINESGGDWDATANWQTGNIAAGSGAIANFNTLDLTANRFITVNADATFGTLNVGDTTTPFFNYVFRTPTSGGPFTWTLDNGVSSPIINVTANATAILQRPAGGVVFNIANSMDLVKDGPGTLSIDAATFTGTGGLNIKQGVFMTWGTFLPAGAITMGDGTSQVTLTGRNDKTALDLSSRAITLNAGTQTLAAKVGGGTTFSSGVISGSGALSLLPTAGSSGRSAGFGNAASNYSGGTTIGAVGSDKFIAAISQSSTFSGGDVTQGPLGTGTVTLNGGGLAAAGGNRTLHNAIVIEQNADLQDGGATTATRNLELAGPVTLSGGTRALTINIARTDGSGKVVISGAIGDGGNGYGLTVQSGGATPALDVLELTGTNTYTGATTISSGTLVLGSTGSIASSSTINVASGATFNVAAVTGGWFLGASQTLMGNGTVSGNATINGNLQPGNSPGLLSFGSNLTLASTANTTMELNGSATRGTDYDGINVTSALVYDGTLSLAVGTTFGVGNYTFNLFDFGSQSGEFDAITLSGNYTGSLTGSGDVWSLTSGDNTWTFTHSTGDLGLTVIPEPSTWALLAASLTALVALRRRRQA